jgi:hypothetical protein
MKTKLNILQTVTAWLWPTQEAAALAQAKRTAYHCWARKHPDWAAVFFDEHFLMQGAAPYLQALATGAKVAEPLLLAGAWADQFPLVGARRQQRVADLLPAAREYLEILQGVLCAQGWHKQQRQARFWPLRPAPPDTLDFPCPEPG